ncbi:MAG: ribosome biogenesis factor YjgA [Pseudohongiella sp.]|nr:ribosome biogenesis factor YjgA [Pseudohongiella sp.]
MTSPKDELFEDGNSSSNVDISKTRRKKNSTELQKMGEDLLSLNKKQLDQIDVSEPLLGALREYQRIPPRHEARRRQLQYIGKLMRATDHELIRAALEKLRTPDRQQVRRSQEIERWGERLSVGDTDDIEAFVEAFPLAERQELRQLLRRFQQLTEKTAEGEAAIEISEPAKAARRRIFDYVKSCMQ